jgi:hypothetical protein
VHNVSDATPGTVSTLTETTAGARLAAGADWFAGRHFVMGLEGDYHAVGHFDHPDALTSHASGFGMSLSLGFAWGGR